VTGHAGLFSTAEDLARLAAEILRGCRGESKLFPRDLLQRFTARRGIVPGSSRAPGWDSPSEGSSAGTRLGPRAFGHTGFTGTSIWLEPDRDLYILLLTNRVHPSRENSKIGAVRRAFADAVVACFEGRRRRV
jgi:CubicO group peptidase (beta-lactamase class C family)